MESSLNRIKEKISRAEGLSPSHKQELLELVNQLYAELSHLSDTDAGRADSVSGFAQVSAHEASTPGRKPETLDYALKGLSSSVEELEASHPKLVETVNRICVMLSDIGI